MLRAPTRMTKALAVFGCVFVSSLSLAADVETPDVLDDRLVLDLFASEPEIVTPVALDVDDRGRVWVIESHTHKRQGNYRGP
ncbi:MAG: hypothetical protein AAF517_12670, partial [Planctomycetota bacterium]